jgi:FMN phosphatase YigB (HAD superfamily)
MKLLLIDLDNTLIDVSGFKEYLFSCLLENFDISKEESHSRYNSIKLKDNWPDLFIKEMFKEFHIPEEKLRTIFEECFSKIRVNKKILDFLNNFEGKKYILSFGPNTFQLKKITLFKLDKLVDGIYITLENKIDFIGKLVKDDQLIIENHSYNDVTLIDDDEELLMNIESKFPWIDTLNPTALL